MRLSLDGKQVFFGTGSGQADSTAPTIVFVHGAGFDHSVWVMPARYFARHGYRVIAPDLPAHGRSEGPPLQTVEAMADWLAQLLVQMQVGRATLVGHSMGSLIVRAFAGRHPALTDKIALLGTSAPMPVGAPLLDAAADNDPAAFAMANTWSHSTAGRMGAASVPGMSNFISGQRWLERMHDDVYFADLNACNQFDLPAVDVSVAALVIAGEQDKMTPLRANLAVAEALPGSTHVILPGCGHAMLSEQPNAVLDALADFVRS